MVVQIEEMTLTDYDEAYQLWQSLEGIGLSHADSKENVARFLARNAGLSFVGRAAGRLVGTILCGDDGRRGYLYHMAVDPDYRRRGVGRRLVDQSLAALKQRGIEKCHLVVFCENHPAISFWEKCGWYRRDELLTMSKDL